MSIADAQRTRALEAKVADLERRLAEIEQSQTKPEPSAAAKKFAENLASRPSLKVDDAA